MSKITVLSILGLLAQVQFSNGALIRRASPDFGTCTAPTIMYVENQDRMLGFGYKPTNNDNFPHGASPDMRTVADFICSNLQNVCRAPTESWFLCTTAAAAAYEKEGQDAVDAFNNAINNISTPSLSSSSGGGEPQVTVHPSVNIKFSTDEVVFDPLIDPKWWFNEYIIADGVPALCDETARRMPDDHWLTFTCEGADERIVPMMKNTLNAVVDATMNAKGQPDEEHMFRQGITYGTVFPASVHIAVSINIPGAGGALSGNLRYTISKSTSNNCGLCGYLANAGGAGSALAGVADAIGAGAAILSPGISVGTAIMGFTCLTTCG